MQANGCFRGQTSRSRGRFSELESERLLFAIADVQITRIQLKSGSAYGQLQTVTPPLLDGLFWCNLTINYGLADTIVAHSEGKPFTSSINVVYGALATVK